jgi:anti-sigma regulatory factor (Ser/Thr protein kinase)
VFKAEFEELTIPNNTQYLKDVREFIARMVRRSRMERSDENKIVLAVDEAVSNIMKHAYKGGTDGTISLEVIVDQRKFQIIIRDSGKSFDPDVIEEPDLEKYVRTGKKQGLGIYLMRRIMDEIRYEFIRGVRNELRMTKYIEK